MSLVFLKGGLYIAYLSRVFDISFLYSISYYTLSSRYVRYIQKIWKFIDKDRKVLLCLKLQ